MEIKILPGAFDNFDGTQEELDELMTALQQMIEDGTLFDNAVMLTEEEFNELPDEIKAQISAPLDEEIGELEVAPQKRLLH